jgi:hypothetical protein
MEVYYDKQSNFPLLAEYAKLFDITDRTIFAYNNIIYSNYLLPKDLIVHEQTHFKQQEKYGLDNWVTKYLTDTKFRLDMEVEAYKAQLASIGDREIRNKIRIESVHNLSSPLYGGIISKEEARILLK